jgi:hypothetical protein
MNVVGPLATGGAAPVNADVAGFAQPALGQPAQPLAVVLNANQEFVDGAVAQGMIIHLHAAEVVANSQITPVDMDTAAEALHRRVAFTQHRNDVLGPVPTGCCKLNA